VGRKAAKRVTISPVLRSNEPEILIQAARQHAGIAVVSTSLVGELLAGGELVRLLPEWRMPTRDVNALYAPGRG
jgi:DNA-binding transcriptional LysR family regulator